VHSSYERLCRIRPPAEESLPGGEPLDRLRALDEWMAQQTLDALSAGNIHASLTHVVVESARICDGIGRELLANPALGDDNNSQCQTS
jgi:hypothetical protein